MITSEPGFGIFLQNEAENRGGDGNQRDVLVTHLLFHEDAESKQTQDRTVGIACQDIYSIDDTGVVQKMNTKMVIPMTTAMPMCTFLRIFTTVSSDLPFVPRMSTVKEVVSAVSAEPAAE